MTPALTAVRQWAAANFATWGAALRWLRAHEIRQDRPCFSSADECLRWAFGHEVPVVKIGGTFAMAGRARDELWETEEDKERAKSAPVKTRDPDLDRRPVGQDAVVQQSMIFGFVRRLPVNDHLYVVARYAQGKERVAARRALRDVLIPIMLSQSIRPHYATYMLICSHFGQRVDTAELATRLEYLFPAKRAAQDARSAVRRLANEIRSHLQDFGASADQAVRDYLQAGGLIK